VTSDIQTATANPLPDNAIAVIGMAARLPGADSVSAFWRNLRRGEESIVSLSEADLSTAGIPDQALANPAYVRRAALLDGIDEFDAEFFGFTPQGARMMDPQHRLFLQCAWHALEDSGYEPGHIDGSVGVYGTSSASGYLLHNLMSHHDPNRILGQGATFDMINLSLQNDKDYLATRISHQFDLRGPALAVQTACSSSLVAVHLACQSILSGECEMALAGAASIRVPHRVGYWHEPGSMVSATGHCRPFDVRADGTVFGSGVAVVVLKPFGAAVADGDRIHAVIRGSAVNNDGSTKMNYAAPNAAGQAEVIAEAHAVAEVDASTVSYVETHGTGTPLGDPIEIEGLRQAFELSTAVRRGPCAIGSVKSNIGHLEVASGIAGLIKTILCLKHRAIPGTLHYTSPNPELRLDRSPFVVQQEYGPWKWDGARRAGVSSFGVGGTNVHLVLEEAPAAASADIVAGPQVLLLSARSADALDCSRSALAADLADDGDERNLADVAFTLAGRRGESVRLAAVVKDQQHAADVLSTPDHDNVFIGRSSLGDESGRETIAFTFPGQGAQHAGMARGLYESEPVFAEQFDLCVAGFADEMDIDLRAEIFDGVGRNLERTDRTQPALFAVEYALARLMEAYGVRPSAVAGHSIGEYAAATIAGVFDLPTAIEAVSMRARLMHDAPGGVMVAVAKPVDAITDYLTPDVDVAAVNESGSCVVAGAEDSIRAFQDRLAADGIVARRVRTSHAFHSRLMDGVVPEFERFLSNLTLREPRIPILSNITGTWMSAREATDPAMWAHQIRATVRFANELDVLLADPSRILVEVGPGGTLTASATRHGRWSDGHRAVRLMRHPVQNRSDHDTFLLALGQLWAAGVEVDWAPLARGHRPRRVTLPGYPFERQRHWVDHRNTAPIADGGIPLNGAAVPRVGQAGGGVARNGASSMEDTVQRIWGQCLGLNSIDRSANFFELGGDSLVAISVAMTAANEGLDLTPQDLYENQTVVALAERLTARYAGGLAGRSLDDAMNPPVPPNISHFLEHGLRPVKRWRIPLVLRLRHDVSIEDVRSVLTAVTNHHDALRLRMTQRAGIWEQHIDEFSDTVDLATRTLPDGVGTDSPEGQHAVLLVLNEQMHDDDHAGAPLLATCVRSADGASCHLAMSLHGMVYDDVSRDVLLGDLFTAFAQRLSGQDIALQPTTTSWREWSQRCAELSTHPAVLKSRDYWLEAATGTTLRIAGSGASRPDADDMVRLGSTLTAAQTDEIDEARRRLRIPIEEILLAALGRTIAGRSGAGTIAVDLGAAGRSVLKPEVSLHRTVGWFTSVYPVALPCAMSRDASARQLIDDVHETLKAVPHYGIGYGLLRYLYAPTARSLAAARPADIHFDYVGVIPDLPSDPSDSAPFQFVHDAEMPVRETVPGLGHPIEMRIYRSAGALRVDWWYDTRRIQVATVAELADMYLLTVLELTGEALAEDELGEQAAELTLIDLSSDDIDVGGINAQHR
jgi:phthiocerol/phenolphthiocerol synthesis type-I polyketide synthase E